MEQAARDPLAPIVVSNDDDGAEVSYETLLLERAVQKITG